MDTSVAKAGTSNLRNALYTAILCSALPGVAQIRFTRDTLKIINVEAGGGFTIGFTKNNVVVSTIPKAFNITWSPLVSYASHAAVSCQRKSWIYRLSVKRMTFGTHIDVDWYSDTLQTDVGAFAETSVTKFLFGAGAGRVVRAGGFRFIPSIAIELFDPLLTQAWGGSVAFSINDQVNFNVRGRSLHRLGILGM